MNSKKLMKIVVIILIFVILQSYFTNPESFSTIIEKWKGYFMTLIMAIFIAILLEPIKKYLKKKSKINDVLAISLSIVFVVLIVVIISLIVIPEIISSLKVLNDIYPAISEKVLTIGKDVTNYLAEKNIYTVDTKELDDYFTKFISNNTSNIKEFVLAFIGGLVNWTLGFTNLIVAFTLAFLILLDKKNLMKTLENLIIIIFGVKNTPYVMNKLKLSKDIFISYISGKNNSIFYSWTMCIYNFTYNRNTLCSFKCYLIRCWKYDTLCWFNSWRNSSIFLDSTSCSNKNFDIIDSNSDSSIGRWLYSRT